MHKSQPDRFLKTAAGRAFVAVASLFGCRAGLVPVPPRHTEYNIASPKWPATHAPLKIVVATDMHVGSSPMPLSQVEEVVRHINDMQADIVLLPGDFLSSHQLLGGYIEPEPIAERLGEIRAAYGVYAVLGNHDWRENGEGMWAALEKNNIRVLENDAVKIGRIGQDVWVAGLADDTTRQPDLAAAFKKVSDNDPVVMMCHDPGTFHDIDQRPVVTICGHTHGGQVRFPFAGAIHLPSRAPLSWAYGHINEEGKDLIVSSGLGTSSLPLRFNCPPEIVSLTLKSAPSPSYG